MSTLVSMLFGFILHSWAGVFWFSVWGFLVPMRRCCFMLPSNHDPWFFIFSSPLAFFSSGLFLCLEGSGVGSRVLGRVCILLSLWDKRGIMM